MIRMNVLIVEDEELHRRRFAEVMNEYSDCKIKFLDGFEDACRFIDVECIDSFDVILIDLRLRPQAFDQSGLTILDMIRRKSMTVPIILLSQYAYDHPGVERISKRYPAVSFCEKDDFFERSKHVLHSVLSKNLKNLGKLPQVDFVIVTALEEERDAMLRQLPTFKQIAPLQDDVRFYYSSSVTTAQADGRTIDYSVIVLCLLGMGRVEAANATGDAIRRWYPRYVLLVGIAGGVAESSVSLGDGFGLGSNRGLRASEGICVRH
jgi:CheY-like chemotaxis protein